ncbi:MAG: hypothetical protein UHI81_02745 [Olegusella sp.]|nr:hypothetical protein [Olegusella sp.]
MDEYQDEGSRGITHSRPDLDTGLEIKNTRMASRYSTFDAYVKKSKKAKEGLVAVVFDLSENNHFTDDEASEMLSRVARNRSQNFILMS